ncbi:VCBS repeat-containing protein, partial [Xenococcus sp. PCC 7305]|uniref:beta strand repeat-containing protein n=1 Tax=Xenococcus sp. PCC 7305 TaxID=102125 RepID=UPI0002ABF9B0
DVNGDGIADIIIGAYRANSNAGESYVVFGSSNPSSSIDLSALDGSNGFVLNGIDANDYSGGSVSDAGDVNGDGTADLIIGANQADPNGNGEAGESYVVFGRDFNTDEDTSFTTSSVLFNDTDADGDPLSVTAIETTGTLGLVTNNGDGTFNYDPNGQFDFLKPGETASDTFIYTVTANGETDTATVTITITGIEDAPVANDDSIIFSAAIELSALNGNNGFVLNGINLGDNSGYSVSNAGDVNGDGIDDVIIGAPFTDINNNNEGESYVVFGDSNVGSSGTIELSALDGSNGFVLKGIDAYDNSGRSVSNAGDINGDGTADLIISADRADTSSGYTGESYVVFGSSDVGSLGTIELSALDGSNGFVLNGIDERDYSSYSVSNAGDVNGDGLDDLIIGAFRADPNGNGSGESYVVFGGSDVGSSGTIELSVLDGSNGFIINGIDPTDYSGRSVSNAGDVNGDGFADLIISARSANPNGSQSGESYVVFGGSDVGNSGTIELSSLDGSNGFVLNGIERSDQSGESISNAGDINGDGIDDLIIGAPFADPVSDAEGESYVVFGSTNLGSSGTIELSSLDGSNGFILNGIDEDDRSGYSVSNAGDVNGDGTDDLIIGALYGDPNGNDEGESYVVFGGSDVGSSGTIELSSLDGSNGFVLNGIDDGDQLGVAVSNAGDINGDGTPDLIIGADRADPNGSGSGESYVIFGRDFSTDEDTIFNTSSVLFNDTDADGDTLTVTSIDTTSTLGLVLNNGDGTFNYDPDGRFDSLSAGETATDTFTYTISDGDQTDTATVTITIDGINDAPIATTDKFSTDEDTAFTTDDVLANDSDPEGDSFTLESIDTTSTLGLVTDNGNGTFDYDPNGQFEFLEPGEFATDSFGYKLVDSNGAIAHGTVKIVIDGIDDDNTKDDLFLGTAKDDSIWGSAADDTIMGLDGNDTLNGEAGNDSLRGLDDHDSLAGNNGDDTLKGGTGNDILAGGNDNDSLNGDSGNDTLLGDTGSDTLAGQSGADSLNGGDDDDSLVGANGIDTLDGGLGNDTLLGQGDPDLLFGQDGDDSLVGGDGDDTLDGGVGNDTLLGQNEADLLFGQENNDRLLGQDGNDTLYGGSGDDTLLGQNNDDVLFGGLGLDSLTGGLGNDRFAIVSGDTVDQDIITDFQDGLDELLLTGGLTFGKLTISQNGSDTDIIETSSSQTLATLINIDAIDIDETDFV